jgi:hypothetical protein
VVVDVTILNDQTGHHVPTDSPLRQMILLVRATAPDGASLPLVDGPTIPGYGGVGDPAAGDYAGLAGKVYAKILTELWTEITPTAAYWNPTRIAIDNRLPAFARDSSRFTFSAAGAPARIDVRVIFRRAFKELMDQKGWRFPDIEMARVILDVP